MNASFYNGLMGIKTYQFGIDVLGDNISNVNTDGFKQRNVDFDTLFSTSLVSNGVVTSDIGVGSTPTTTTMDLSQGSIKKTDNVFDMAIEGKGWVKVKDRNNQDFYTRTGSFTRDANGELVDANGDKLQVVNAHNLTNKNGEWTFDANIPTDNLVTPSSKTEPIKLPDNVTFPAKSTENISIKGNLPNTQTAPDPKPALLNNNFGVLYDDSAQNMNLQNGQDVVFGFGDNIKYEDQMIRYTQCITDDKVDGKNVNIDFNVNDTNIKLTLPDGSTKKVIIDAIAKKLDDNNILYDKGDDYIKIKDADNLKITPNGGDIFKTPASMKRLVYNSDNSNNNFHTLQDFIDKIQSMADDVYPNDTTVGLDKKGEVYIQNNTDNVTLNAISSKGKNSNDKFIQNLGALGNIIRPNTASNSLKFQQDYQGFTGTIVDSKGNKDDLKFDFYKTDIQNNQTIWKLNLTQTDPNGNIISQSTQNLTFDNIGGLLTPNEITIDNDGKPAKISLGQNFSGITAIDKDNSGFEYSQDGILEGYLKNYDVDENGDILANFSNGHMGVLGQVPLYHFQNEQGLDASGSNLYTETSNSGKAFLYQNSDGSYLEGAKLKNYSLETSNVKLSSAMTELIITQKAFDANAKSITTSDQMIKKAIDMKR